MNTSRRQLLRTTALGIPAALLASCAGTTSPTVTQLATDTNLIASGMAAVVTALQSIQPPLPAATLATLQSYLTTLQTDAAAVAKATATPATSVIQEIATVVQAIAPIALSFIPGGGTLGAVVQAALQLLPAVTSVVNGLAGASLADAGKFDQARLVLAGAGKR